MSHSAPAAPIRIAMIGDYNPAFVGHTTADDSIRHVAAAHGLGIESAWVPTPSIPVKPADAARALEPWDGLWISAGSPYASPAGALAAIRVARERGKPLIATCGGFQHVLLEHARNVLGLVGAAHAEEDPDAAMHLLWPVACPVPDRAEGAPKLSGHDRVFVREGTVLHDVLGLAEIDQEYFCNYEPNPAHRELFEQDGIQISAESEHGEVRGIERAEHPFFIGVLFQPQRSSRPEAPHPLIAAFVGASADHSRTRPSQIPAPEGRVRL